MVTINDALVAIPESHRIPLIDEFKNIHQNYLAKRWSPSELSGGRFCEIVYSIIDGIANTYAPSPVKPKNMEAACKALENHTHLNRSFRILIPRVLPILYEIRNNRNVGHIGGDIDPNSMDCISVLTLANWIMAEFVRVLHSVSIDEAKKLVDSIIERSIPLVWSQDNIKRVLIPSMSLSDKILVLLASCDSKESIENIMLWNEVKNKSYFYKIIKKLHDDRMIEHNITDRSLTLLPPGIKYVDSIFFKLV